MKILVEGTEKEVEMAKSSLESVCLFNSEFCNSNNGCKECELEQSLEIEYIIRDV